jgi:hypothetical protein
MSLIGLNTSNCMYLVQRNNRNRTDVSQVIAKPTLMFRPMCAYVRAGACEHVCVFLCVV